MSLYGMMRTSVSGMQAQANRLSAVADNIANSDTTGYKAYTTHFSQLVTPGIQSENSLEFGSGGVITDLRQSISQQGTLEYTNSVTDLAINGNGFFVVNDPAGMPFLTRAGSFVPDSEGRLVNSAGMALTGYSLENGPVSAVANGFGGLEEISIIEFDLIANASTAGQFQANLPSDTVPTTAPLPSGNLATAEFDQKTSLVVYDNLGEEKLVDMYFTNTSAGNWEVAVFDQADAALGTGFPYASAALATTTLSFDLTTGALTGASANSVAFTVPNGTATTIDLSQMSQLAADYTVLDASVNGNPPAPITGVDIGTDGILHARYGDGSFHELYQIPLATVTSPDRLVAETGQLFPGRSGIRHRSDWFSWKR